MTALPESMSVAEVSTLLGRAKRTVTAWCKERKLPARRIGARIWRIKPRLLEERDPELYAELLELFEERERERLEGLKRSQQP